jgi:anaerobic magnesium-protoporphyrin IX monomethyl ester cyclase
MQSLVLQEGAPDFAVAPQAQSMNCPPADVTAWSARASPSPPAKQRLLFLHPKTLVDSWPFPVDTLGEVVKAPSAVYPVLASFVSDLPVEIEIFDGYVTRESFANYKQRLRRADFIAISQMSPLKALDTELTIRLAKALNPDVLVILGGNHASSFPDDWIRRGADFVVVGEGEIAFPKLMQTILSGKQDFGDVPNLVYRHGDGSCATGVKAAEADLNASPLPRWDLVDLRPYDLGLRTGGLTAAIEVSRGCPHRCDFCNINTYWGYRQRYKSVARVCDELEQLHRLGVREFIFTDDNFAQDHRHTTQLLEEMVRRKLGMRFGSFMRGDTVNRHPEFVELAASAGMTFCLMGIETLDPGWLKNHSKGVRANDVVAMYEKVYRTLKSNGISVIGLFITPAEADTKFVSGSHADGVVCDAHYTADLAALKGSALYGRLVIENSVAKDMFYHDWNLPSIRLQDGREQMSRKKLRPAKRWNVAAFKTAFIGPLWARRFHWRNLAVIAERLICSSWADIQRYRVAKNPLVPLASRQAYIVDSVINPRFLARLLRGRRHKSPLTLRNGLWSDRPPANSYAGNPPLA